MCPAHNDFGKFCQDGRRPERFWESATGAFSLLLFNSDEELVPHEEDPYLIAHELLVKNSEEEVSSYDGVESGEDTFKVGGIPFRANNEVHAQCGSGSRMSYICEVPGGHGFRKIGAI